MWPNVKDAIARAKAFNRAHPERMGDSIALFEDDANVVVASAEAYAEKVSSVIGVFPDGGTFSALTRTQTFVASPSSSTRVERCPDDTDYFRRTPPSPGRRTSSSPDEGASILEELPATSSSTCSSRARFGSGN